MRDLIRFVLRGGWASAGFAVLLMAWLYGPIALGFLLDPYLLFRFVSPGAFVGVVLWVVSGKSSKPLTWILRMAIGTVADAAIRLGIPLFQLLMNPFELIGIDIVMPPLSTLFLAVGFGGLAGLACPSSREDRTAEDHLTYRERLKLYEAAEKEAQAARMRLRSISTSQGERTR